MESEAHGRQHGRQERHSSSAGLQSRAKPPHLRFAADILESPPDQPDFLHTVFCQVGLPRRATPHLKFERQMVSRIPVGEGRKPLFRPEMAPTPPHGPKPRLALVTSAPRPCGFLALSTAVVPCTTSCAPRHRHEWRESRISASRCGRCRHAGCPSAMATRPSMPSRSRSSQPGMPSIRNTTLDEA